MKRKLIFLTGLLTAVLLTGCAGRNIEELYALPRRSQEYRQVEDAINTAMEGLDYSAPRSGTHQQTVQRADLDGDGEEEYLVFAKGSAARPLQILIFKQSADGSVHKLETIVGNGLEFEQVEYVYFDDKPGCELVIGQRIADQVLRSVSVYTFAGGSSELILLNSYSNLITCDLNQDGQQEIMLLRPGEGVSQRGMAVLYSFRDGQIVRSLETELSEDVTRVRRIVQGTLADGVNAVYIASVVEDEAITTDIFTVREGRFTNISVYDMEVTSVETLHNFYVYCEDIDGDGSIELPSLITMKPISLWEENEQRSLIRWISLTSNGWPVDKVITYHNHLGGWYLALDGSWAGRITVEQTDNTFHFYLWDESYNEASPLFSLYVFTGASRDELSTSDGRFPLYRAEGIAYAGKLQLEAGDCGITEDTLVNSFHLIAQVGES